MACSRDTDGDGNCGRKYCPECGIDPATLQPLDPTCAFHGLKWSEHEFGRCLYCCICFETLTPDECYTDPEGSKWDMCQDCGDREESIRQANLRAAEGGIL